MYIQYIYICVCVCAYIYTWMYLLMYCMINPRSIVNHQKSSLWQETIPCHDLAEAFAITSRPERCVVPLSTLHQNSSIAKVMGRQWIGHLAALGPCATNCVVLCDAHDMLAIFRHDMDVKSLEAQMYILYINAVIQ